MTQINADGFTPSDISTTRAVLSEIADRATDSDEQHMIDTVSVLVQRYEEESEWREEQPAERVDVDDYEELGTFANG